MVSIAYDFVEFGELLDPTPGRIAVDVGSRCVPGIIDHHLREATGECATSLVVNQPALVLDHLAAWSSDVTVVLHREPDLDCVAAAYVVKSLLTTGQVPQGAAVLAEYVKAVDAGKPPPGGIGPDSIWALYTATTQIQRVSEGRVEEYRLFEKWLERGFELLGIALSQSPLQASLPVPEQTPGWEAERNLVREDRERYLGDREGAQQVVLSLPTPAGGRTEVRGLVVEGPTSILFKHFARAEGFTFTHVIYAPTERGASRRHVISVAPERGVWLRGLGTALERQEDLVRARKHQLRPGPPRWPDVTNRDPWYDGRASLHGYTIVDTPRAGTVLSSASVKKLVCNVDAWAPLASGRDLVCPEGCKVKDPEAAFCPHHGKQLVPAVIDSRYDVLGLIGEGGMGVVFRVRDRVTGQVHALKVIRHCLRDDRSLWQRLKREATVLQQIDHPNVVKLIDYGIDPSTGPYIVSELVPGKTLSEDLEVWQSRGKPYPLSRVEVVITRVCDALKATHSRDVLHRDLKPDNIKMAESPEGVRPVVTVLDYGIALPSAADGSSATMTAVSLAGQFIGTPAYAAPEQLRVNLLDPRVDLYALGTMLYELLTGTLPFPVSPWLKCAEQAPRVGKTRAEHRGTELEQLVADLLAQDPKERPKSAAAVLKRLGKVSWA